jgi:hypothetical protein
MIPWGHLLWIIPLSVSAGYIFCGLFALNKSWKLEDDEYEDGEP